MTPNAPAATLQAPQREGQKYLEEKAKQKARMQRQLGWPEEPKRAILCLPLGMTDELGGALLKDILPGLLTLPIEILIRGKGTAAYGKLFTELAKNHGHRIAIIPNQESAVRQMLQASDMTLLLHAPEIKEIVPCLAAGAVPLSPAAEILDDYNPNQETGNAFTYAQPNAWHCFGSAVRALETFRFPFDWRTIQLHGLEAVGH